MTGDKKFLVSVLLVDFIDIDRLSSKSEKQKRMDD